MLKSVVAVMTESLTMIRMLFSTMTFGKVRVACLMMMMVLIKDNDRRDGKTESLMMIMMPSGATIAGMRRKD